MVLEVPEVPEVPEVREVREVRGILQVVAVVAALAGMGGIALAQTRNPRQLAEAAMLKADREFNQAVAERNMEKFLSLVSENAAFDSTEGRGRDVIKKAWAPFFDPNGPRLSWAPSKAESLVAGDVGYTVGTWERRTKDARGNPIVRHGQYLTVWRKEKDGVWRATFDTGSTSPEGARVRPLTK